LIITNDTSINQNSIRLTTTNTINKIITSDRRIGGESKIQICYREQCDSCTIVVKPHEEIIRELQLQNASIITASKTFWSDMKTVLKGGTIPGQKTWWESIKDLIHLEGFSKSFKLFSLMVILPTVLITIAFIIFGAIALITPIFPYFEPARISLT